MPIICYTYGSLAYYSRFIRANMQEVIRQDYIRTARAKGVGPVRVLVHHAFRNTLIPLVTMIGLTLPYLLSGSIILEQIFSWPGMGKLFFESIRERDYPTIMGLMLMFSVLTLLGPDAGRLPVRSGRSTSYLPMIATKTKKARRIRGRSTLPDQLHS